MEVPGFWDLFPKNFNLKTEDADIDLNDDEIARNE
jgi:hypothetical protein